MFSSYHGGSGGSEGKLSLGVLNLPQFPHAVGWGRRVCVSAFFILAKRMILKTQLSKHFDTNLHVDGADLGVHKRLR